MGKIIITEFVSLDGVAEAPEKWSLNFWNSETEAFKTEELAAHSAMLLGRVTYEGFAAAWPSRTGDYADRLNALPKHVASKTLKTLTWKGAELLAPGMAESVKAIKKKTAGNIYVHGSIGLSQALLAAGLADELHILSYPIVLGKGRKLLENTHQFSMDLISSAGFSNGVLALKYRVKPS